MNATILEPLKLHERTEYARGEQATANGMIYRSVSWAHGDIYSQLTWAAGTVRKWTDATCRLE